MFAVWFHQPKGDMWQRWLGCAASRGAAEPAGRKQHFLVHMHTDGDATNLTKKGPDVITLKLFSGNVQYASVVFFLLKGPIAFCFHKVSMRC